MRLYRLACTTFTARTNRACTALSAKAENGNFGTETLTIPAGADVTLHNMKIYSSVKIVVEKGGKLTLDDSVAYGAVEVNGGTLSAKNSSSFVNQITLKDGPHSKMPKSVPC